MRLGTRSVFVMRAGSGSVLVRGAGQSMGDECEDRGATGRMSFSRVGRAYISRELRLCVDRLLNMLQQLVVKLDIPATCGSTTLDLPTRAGCQFGETIEDRVADGDSGEVRHGCRSLESPRAHVRRIVVGHQVVRGTLDDHGDRLINFHE